MGGGGGGRGVARRGLYGRGVEKLSTFKEERGFMDMSPSEKKFHLIVF